MHRLSRKFFNISSLSNSSSTLKFSLPLAFSSLLSSDKSVSHSSEDDEEKICSSFFSFSLLICFECCLLFLILLLQTELCSFSLPLTLLILLNTLAQLSLLLSDRFFLLCLLFLRRDHHFDYFFKAFFYHFFWSASQCPTNNSRLSWNRRRIRPYLLTNVTAISKIFFFHKH